LKFFKNKQDWFRKVPKDPMLHLPLLINLKLTRRLNKIVQKTNFSKGIFLVMPFHFVFWFASNLTAILVLVKCICYLVWGLQMHLDSKNISVKFQTKIQKSPTPVLQLLCPN